MTSKDLATRQAARREKFKATSTTSTNSRNGDRRRVRVSRSNKTRRHAVRDAAGDEVVHNANTTSPPPPISGEDPIVETSPQLNDNEAAAAAAIAAAAAASDMNLPEVEAVPVNPTAEEEELRLLRRMVRIAPAAVLSTEEEESRPLDVVDEGTEPAPESPKTKSSKFIVDRSKPIVCVEKKLGTNSDLFALHFSCL